MNQIPTKVNFLLVNLGTPNSPNPQDVGKYLREFLMDPMVIDKNYFLRFFLVNCIIVPFRKKKSSHAYKKIWTNEGSPLMTHSLELSHKLRSKLSSEYNVFLAMRYGQPALEETLKKISEQYRNTPLVVIPLYPQEAKSSSGTVVELVRKSKDLFLKPIQVLRPFYKSQFFIDSYVNLIRRYWEYREGDHLYFSFHGLPERHVKEVDAASDGCLMRRDCCEVITDRNQNCYRAQCFATAHLIANQLKLKKHQWTVSFQSRLGREPWIQPYTDEVVNKSVVDGQIRRVVMVAPAFVSDCLETLEELGVNLKEDLNKKGMEFLLLPCLNADDYWVDLLAQALTESDLNTYQIS